MYIYIYMQLYMQYKMKHKEYIEQEFFLSQSQRIEGKSCKCKN